MLSESGGVHSPAVSALRGQRQEDQLQLHGKLETLSQKGKQVKTCSGKAGHEWSHTPHKSVV